MCVFFSYLWQLVFPVRPLAAGPEPETLAVADGSTAAEQQSPSLELCVHHPTLRNTDTHTSEQRDITLKRL